jgi:hypothetical protein
MLVIKIFVNSGDAPYVTKDFGSEAPYTQTGSLLCKLNTTHAKKRPLLTENAFCNLYHYLSYLEIKFYRDLQ